MDSLPTELLLAIVRLIINDQPTLARCNRINKRWHALTRVTLYREPQLVRLPALQAFLRTVDTPDMEEYCRATKMNHIEPSDQNATFKLSSISTIPTSTRSQSIIRPREPDSSNPRSSFLSSRIPAGCFVDTIDLSMMPHRWETVHYGFIDSIVRGCPFLSTLNLSACDLLRDRAVQLIAEQLGPRRLKSLVLSGCSKVSDLGVLSLCAHAVQIENLELSCCDRITDISILELGSAVVSGRSDSSLVSIQFQDEESGRMGLANANPAVDIQGISRSLKSLDLSHCTRITDTGIKGLRLGATQLSSLNLEGCFGVLLSDDGLTANEWEDLEDDDDELGDSDFDGGE